MIYLFKVHFCQELIVSGNVENMSWWKNVPFIYWSKICPSKKRPAASLTTCVIILRRRRYFHLLGKILKPCTRNLVSAKIVNVRQCHSCLHFSTFSKCHSHPTVAGRIDARLSKTHANIQKSVTTMTGSNLLCPSCQSIGDLVWLWKPPIIVLMAKTFLPFTSDTPVKDSV